MTFKDVFQGLSRSWIFQEKIQDFRGGMGTLLIKTERILACKVYKARTKHVITAHLLLSASANNAVNAVKCPGSDKQDVRGVDRDSVATCSACAAIWHVDCCTFEQL